jgi:regulator of nucleoside diphosphate kinase
MRGETKYIRETDCKRIEQLYRFCEIFKEEEKISIQRLQFEVSEGNMVPDDQLPPDVVAINAKVHIQDIETGKKFWMSLVFPEDADTKYNRISLLSPISRCLLGARAGETVNCVTLTGYHYLQILKVINQPDKKAGVGSSSKTAYLVSDPNLS